MDEQKQNLTGLTAHIVGAYVEKNPVPLGNIGELIASVSTSLQGLNSTTELQAENVKPAVSPKRSVKPDFIGCIECGKNFKSLRRHLNSKHGLTPDEYRSKWNLSGDYPMVAPNYTVARSEMAKKMGLGRKPGTKVKKRSRTK